MENNGKPPAERGPEIDDTLVPPDAMTRLDFERIPRGDYGAVARYEGLHVAAEAPGAPRLTMTVVVPEPTDDREEDAVWEFLGELRVGLAAIRGEGEAVQDDGADAAMQDPPSEAEDALGFQLELAFSEATDGPHDVVVVVDPPIGRGQSHRWRANKIRLGYIRVTRGVVRLQHPDGRRDDAGAGTRTTTFQSNQLRALGVGVGRNSYNFVGRFVLG